MELNSGHGLSSFWKNTIHYKSIRINAPSDTFVCETDSDLSGYLLIVLVVIYYYGI